MGVVGASVQHLSHRGRLALFVAYEEASNEVVGVGEVMCSFCWGEDAVSSAVDVFVLDFLEGFYAVGIIF